MCKIGVGWDKITARQPSNKPQRSHIYYAYSAFFNYETTAQ